MEQRFLRRLKSMPVRGWNSVSVPGCVSAWVELHARFGKLPFEKLFERAIRYGREGFLVSPTIAGQWEKQVPELRNQPGFAEAFMPNGRAPRPGERFTWKSHAEVLEQIAQTAAKPSIAARSPKRIEAHARKHDAAMRAVGFRRAQERLGHSARDGLPRHTRCTRSRRTARGSWR
jgi:gamma-glutamyltranspeptidase/glutathione hydrolase